MERVKQDSTRHGIALSHGRLLRLLDGEVAVGYPKEAALHRDTVATSRGKELIEKALGQHFGRPTRLIIEDATSTGADAPISLAEEEARDRQAHEKSTDARVRTHPSVRAVLKHLGGEIEHITVLEKTRPPVPEAMESPEEGS